MRRFWDVCKNWSERVLQACSLNIFLDLKPSQLPAAVESVSLGVQMDNSMKEKFPSKPFQSRISGKPRAVVSLEAS